MRFRVLGALALVLAVALALSAVQARAEVAQPGGLTQPPSHSSFDSGKVVALNGNPTAVPPATRPNYGHMSSHLYDITQARTQQIARGGLSVMSALAPMRVIATPASGVSLAQLANLITQAGGTIDHQLTSTLSVDLSAPAIVNLSNNAQVALLEEPTAFAPMPPQAGLSPQALEEGVQALRADKWTAKNWQGAGINIAVFDLDFTGIEDNYTGLAPYYSCVHDTHTFTPDGTIQGHTARTTGLQAVQVICAVAPLASVYVVRLRDAEDMQPAIDYLLTGQFAPKKLDIISSSLTASRPQSPGDGSAPALNSGAEQVAPDGSNQAIAYAQSKGILWINAVGDFRMAHWSGLDVLGNGSTLPQLEPFDGLTGSLNTLNNFTWTKAGGPVAITARWTGEWPLLSHNTEFDLVVDCKDSKGVNTEVKSENATLKSYPYPRQSVIFPDPNAVQPTTDLNCGISLFRVNSNAAAQVWIDLFVLSPLVTLQYNTPQGSVHSEENAFDVGAYCYSSLTVDPHSSYGVLNNPNDAPTPMPANKAKPDILGPSSVSTSFGSASGCSTGFSGTVSAAPHIAGEAALWWGWQRGTKNPSVGSAETQAYIKSNLNPNAPANQIGIGGGFAWMGDPPGTNNGTATLLPTGIDTRTPTPPPTLAQSPTPPPTPVSDPLKVQTVGIYRPQDLTFYLRTSNSTGAPNLTLHISPDWGGPYGYPIVGDWNGDGIDTVGMYNQATGEFHLSNANNDNTTLQTDVYFVLGYPNDQPLAGRWHKNDQHDGPGVFRPSNGLIYLRTSLDTGFADYVIVLGIPGDIGVAGYWLYDPAVHDTNDTMAVYRPPNSRFYMTLSTCATNQCSQFGDKEQTFGNVGDLPVVGDWNGFSHDGLGVFRQSTGTFYLKNDAAIPDNAPPTNPDFAFTFGIPGDMPVAGHWLAGAMPQSVGKPNPNILVSPTGLASPSPSPSTMPRGTPIGGGSMDG